MSLTVVLEQPDDYDSTTVETQTAELQATVLTVGGGSGVNYYEHVQTTAAEVWTVTHNLGFRPAVSTFDTNGDALVGQPAHIDTNRLSVSFATAVAGRAYLS